MLDLNDVRIFCRVVEKGSQIAAAKSLSFPSSTVSRRLTALEQQAGVRLLQRNTRTLSPTEEGQRLYRAMHLPLREMVDAEQVLNRSGGIPQGRLRITAPPLFAHFFLTPIACRFMALYVDTQVEIIASRSRLNLIDEALDLAIRAGQADDSNMIARALKPLPLVLAAAPGYLQQQRLPDSVTDLHEHDLIVFNASASRHCRWSLNPQTELNVEGRLATSSYEQALSACRAGVGIALLPQFLVADDVAAGKLTLLLPEVVTQSLSLHLLYPSRQLQPAKLRAFIDLLLSELGPD